jgi:RNA polymerase sigma-70 factor (ECF subfamily)
LADAQTALAQRDLVEHGLRRLPQDQRAVLVLTYYLDLSQAEAARTLGVPVGTLKSRLSRALEALRAELEADDRADRLLEARPA